MQLASLARQRRMFGRYDSVKPSNGPTLLERRSPSQKIASRHNVLKLDIDAGKKKLAPVGNWTRRAPRDEKKETTLDSIPMRLVASPEGGGGMAALIKASLNDEEDEEDLAEGAQIRPDKKGRPQTRSWPAPNL